MPSIPRLREYKGPAVLSYGFRLFYLSGSLFAGLAMFAWLPMMNGSPPRIGAFLARDWHIHELLFGFLPAIICGYITTAIPNWTGRFPVQGMPVLTLLLIWSAGRLAMILSSALHAAVVLAVDCAFLLILLAAVVREIYASGSPRNTGIAAALSLLLTGNLIFHSEVLISGMSDFGWRFGIATILGLIMMIGGRIIPSFTRNWLARAPGGALPAPFGVFDRVCIAVSVMTLLYWTLVPYGAIAFSSLIIAGILQTVRLARWAGHRTAGNPLIFILHAGYAFVPVGFVLTALGAEGLLAPSAGLHAWTAGAAGTMVLAVMTRTSLGLTGRTRIAGPGTQAIYLLVVAGAILRIAAAAHPGVNIAVLHAAGGFWAAAYLGFFVIYWPVLTSKRPSQ
jgi:uncharacterized protein involved in response to NO